MRAVRGASMPRSFEATSSIGPTNRGRSLVRMHGSLKLWIALGVLTGLGAASRPALSDPAADVAAARAVFRRNIEAIQHRDRAAYLDCYLHAETLVRSGPTGFVLGYEPFAKARGPWPDTLEATDLRLTPVRDGMIYGTYRYRVVFDGVETQGLSERLFVSTEQGWRIAMTTAFEAPPGTPPPPRALVGGTLVDGTGKKPVPNALVLIRDGKIEYAGTRRGQKIPAGVDTLDVRGEWITPGLVDAHVHYSQTGWADGRPDAMDMRDKYPYAEVQARLRQNPKRFHRAYLRSGVTAVFDVGGFPWSVAMAHTTENDPRAPRMAAAGPLLSTLDHWLNLPAERQFIHLTNDSIARAGVRYLKSIGSDAVKVWFIVNSGQTFENMERSVRSAGDEARKVGLPLIVHATGMKEAKAALRAGAKLLVHSVDDTLVDQEFISLLRRNGTLYCPTLTVRGGYYRMFAAAREGRPPVVDDPLHAVDSLTLVHVLSSATVGAAKVANRRVPAPEAVDKVRRTMDANLIKVLKAGVPIATGTDAGNPLTLHGPAIFAEMEAMQAAGMKPGEVLTASTRNGARAMRREKDFGTVEKGRLADLVVVQADPTRDIAAMRQIAYVVRGGVVRAAGEPWSEPR